MTTFDPLEVTISEDALAALAEARTTAFAAELAGQERRSAYRAAVDRTGRPATATPAWRERVRDAESQAALDLADRAAHVAARDATAFAAVADFQLFARPWPYQRINVSPGNAATVDLQGGEAYVGIASNGSDWAAGAAEMGGPFRLPTFSDFEFRTTIDHQYDWLFFAETGSADSKGYIEVFVDELLDAPGSTWRNVLDRRFPLWEDETGSFGSDGTPGASDRITVNERFHGRADANYVWWVGAHASVQSQFEAYSQVHLHVDVLYPVVIARV